MLHLKLQLLPSCPHLLLASGQLGWQLLLPTRQLLTYVWHGADVFLWEFFEGYFWYWFYHSLNSSPQDFPPLSWMQNHRYIWNRNWKLNVGGHHVGDLVIFVFKSFLVFFKLFLRRLQWSAGNSCCLKPTGWLCLSNAVFKFHTTHRQCYKIWCIDHTILTRGWHQRSLIRQFTRILKIASSFNFLGAF